MDTQCSCNYLPRAPRAEIGKKIGDVACEVFQNEQTKQWSLAKGRKGKWTILFFYPADFTFVCPTELGELAGMYGEFKKMNTEIVSVSTDTVYVHKAWHDVSLAIQKVSYPMAADPTGKLSRMFGVYDEESGLARRGTFIIDPDGVLQCAEVHANAIGRSASELLRTLRAAQYVRAHTGEVCPASWESGAKTLRDDIKNVGKI